MDYKHGDNSPPLLVGTSFFDATLQLLQQLGKSFFPPLESRPGLKVTGCNESDNVLIESLRLTKLCIPLLHSLGTLCLPCEQAQASLLVGQRLGAQSPHLLPHRTDGQPAEAELSCPLLRS